ncbi:hypothetical protein BKA83DRAFT_4198810, partial [Pisolithus microcarpus]
MHYYCLIHSYLFLFIVFDPQSATSPASLCRVSVVPSCCITILAFRLYVLAAIYTSNREETCNLPSMCPRDCVL